VFDQKTWIIEKKPLGPPTDVKKATPIGEGLNDLEERIGAAFSGVPKDIAVLSVKEAPFNAKGNGSANDTAAIEAAIAAALALGGAVIVFPPGTYLTDPIKWTGDNVVLQGRGKCATTLKLRNGSDQHAVNWTGHGNAIEWMTVDGNRANQSTGHGVRFSGEHNEISHARILRTKTYGIAMAQTTGESVKHTLINDVYLDEIGRDGIDVKDEVDGNEANYISNVTVDRSGINEANGEAAIDLRGPWQVRDVNVLTVEGENAGIRLREGDSGTTGWGCEGSSLNSFYVKVSPSATQASGVISASPDVSISDGYVDLNGGIGTAVTGGIRNKVSSVTVVNGTNAGGGLAFWQPASQKAIQFLGCVAEKCRTGFLVAGERASIFGGLTEECSVFGVNPSGSSGLRINGLSFSGNAADINYSGTASAGTLTLPTFVDVVPITGTTEIKKITASANGRRVALIFEKALTVKNGENLKLGADFAAAAGSTLTLICDGTNWYPA
jgi:hypothetical protein